MDKLVRTRKKNNLEFMTPAEAAFGRLLSQLSVDYHREWAVKGHRGNVWRYLDFLVAVPLSKKNKRQMKLKRAIEKGKKGSPHIRRARMFPRYNGELCAYKAVGFEIDGGYHRDQVNQDLERDNSLMQVLDCPVFRLTNNLVLNDPKKAKRIVRQTLASRSI